MAVILLKLNRAGITSFFFNTEKWKHLCSLSFLPQRIQRRTHWQKPPWGTSRYSSSIVTPTQKNMRVMFCPVGAEHTCNTASRSWTTGCTVFVWWSEYSSGLKPCMYSAQNSLVYQWMSPLTNQFAHEYIIHYNSSNNWWDLSLSMRRNQVITKVTGTLSGNPQLDTELLLQPMLAYLTGWIMNLWPSGGFKEKFKALALSLLPLFSLRFFKYLLKSEAQRWPDRQTSASLKHGSTQAHESLIIIRQY